MKFIIQTLAIVVCAYLLEIYFPWWSVALAALICGYVLKSNYNFLAGFLGIGLLWGVAAYIIEINSAAPLAERVAKIFTINKLLLFFATAIIGGLVGGFSSLTGSLFKKNKRKNLYY